MHRRTRLVAKWLGTLSLGLAIAIFYLLHRGVIVSDEHPIPECPRVLGRGVEGLVRPVLSASRSLNWGPNYGALDALCADKSDQALEAKVALMAYYLGEHPGEELVESVLEQHDKATPLVQQYMECRPPLPGEWRIGTLFASRTKYERYLREQARRRLTTR
jgi:hypothetical protein